MVLKKQKLRDKIKKNTYKLMSDGVTRQFRYILAYNNENLKKEITPQEFAQYLRSCKGFIERIKLSPSTYVFIPLRTQLNNALDMITYPSKEELRQQHLMMEKQKKLLSHEDYQKWLFSLVGLGK